MSAAMLRVIVLVLSLLGSLTIQVEAGPKKGAMTEKQKEKQGRAHFARGKELADAARYVEALVELTKGYELTGRPLFLFNMAEAARAMGDAAQAKELYEKYLAAEANGPFANAARARLVELTPPPPEPAPDPTPTPPPVVIPPPREAAAAVDKPAAADLTARPAPAKEESHTLRNVLIVSIGLAVIGGAVGVYVVTRGPDCGAGCVDLR